MPPTQQPDLLDQYQTDRRRRLIRRQLLVVLAVVSLGAAAVLEPIEFHTNYVVNGVVLTLMGAVGLAISLAYAGLMFWIGRLFGGYLRERGQTRAIWFQAVGVGAVAALAPLMMATLAATHQLAPTFWIPVGFFGWTNLSCTILGYISCFLPAK